VRVEPAPQRKGVGRATVDVALPAPAGADVARGAREAVAVQIGAERTADAAAASAVLGREPRASRPTTSTNVSACSAMTLAFLNQFPTRTEPRPSNSVKTRSVPARRRIVCLQMRDRTGNVILYGIKLRRSSPNYQRPETELETTRCAITPLQVRQE
jgi:hypothetical protein